MLQLRGFKDSWSTWLLNKANITNLTGLAYFGEGQRSFLFFPEQINNFIRVHCVLVTSDGLGDEHLDDSNHASPADICKLLQSAIGKPNNLLEVIVEHITTILSVAPAQEAYLLLVGRKGQGGAGAEGKLEDAVVLDVVGDVGSE
jgi:hypothetical protein